MSLAGGGQLKRSSEARVFCEKEHKGNEVGHDLERRHWPWSRWFQEHQFWWSNRNHWRKTQSHPARKRSKWWRKWADQCSKAVTQKNWRFPKRNAYWQQGKTYSLSNRARQWNHGYKVQIQCHNEQKNKRKESVSCTFRKETNNWSWKINRYRKSVPII